MIKASIGVQDPRRRIYVKVKAEPSWRFMRRGFGWNRWSSSWLYGTLGLFDDYGLRRGPRAESAAGTIGPITLEAKPSGKRSAGKPHAAFDVAGAGNGLTVWLVRHSRRKRGVNG